MSISAHFGDVIWGFDPLNVVRYFRNPKRHILGWKHAFWHIDHPDWSRNATRARAEKSKKKKKEKKANKLRYVTSHIFAQTTHVALSH